MKIPLCKPSIDSKEIKTVSKLLKTQWLSHGAYNNKFEENLINYLRQNILSL